MVTDTANYRPYASPTNVIAVLSRVRTRSLPNPLTSDFLRIAGVPEASHGRVIQALRFLNLIYEDGRPTDRLSALASASDAQYRELLEGVVREAYRAEFEMVDPGSDPQGRIQDAFQRYEPRSQIGRMVILFLGLCREAGIPVLDAPKQRQMNEGKPRRQRQPVSKKEMQPTSGRGRVDSNPPALSNLIFGVTEDDLAALGDDFEEVWTALGKVALARAKSRRQEAIPEEPGEQGKES